MASDISNTGVREAGIPAVPRKLDSDVVTMLEALRERVEILSGTRGDASARAVRVADLNAGILLDYMPTADDVGKNTTPGGGGSRTLKPVRNLQYEHKIFAIRLTWTNVETDYSHVEIWCAADSNSLDDAKRAGISSKPMNEWTHNGISTEANYYYWLRVIGWDGAISPWCPAQGGFVVPASEDSNITEILNLLIGQITEDQLYSALSAEINDNTTTVGQLKGMYFVKTSVDGYVSGYGLYNTGATSEFIVLADKFMVVTPGKNPTVPFVVGSVNGISVVGINGNLVVDGTIKGRSIEAETITGDKIGAEEISGREISAASSIILSDGGKLTVGNNNVVLDSITESIRVASDNGASIGQTNYTGVDYVELYSGDALFKYWNGATGQHVTYNTIKRIEAGMNVANNSLVTIPGIWKHQPKIIVSPSDIMTYNNAYNAQQSLVCSADNITRSGLTFTFNPRAYLRLTNGSTGIHVSLSAYVSSTKHNQSWFYVNTTARNTPASTTSLSVYGTIGGRCRGTFRFCNEGGCSDRPVSKYFYVRAWVYVDGVEYYVGEWSADNLLDNTWTLTKTISGLPSGVHSYYVRLGYMHIGDFTLVEMDGWLTISNESTNQSTFTSVADGFLNYLAVGE